MSRDSELEAFKTGINLTAYMAAEHGYQLDRKESSRNSAVMRGADGDKLIVARGHDGHWIYFSVRDDADHGSIIDFLQKRRPGSLGQVRQALRPWIGATPPKVPTAGSFAARLDPASRDRAQVMAQYARFAPAGPHPYLTYERYIPAHVLESPRFATRIRRDERGNAVFPHYDREGLCGYELKNAGFTGFAKHGAKGLWFSAIGKTDTRLVFAESAIDALSYAALHGDAHTRYASIGGELNPHQPALIRATVRSLPQGASVVAAMDADEPGRVFAGRIRAIAAGEGRALTLHEPPREGTDWNDALRQRGGEGIGAVSPDAPLGP